MATYSLDYIDPDSKAIIEPYISKGYRRSDSLAFKSYKNATLLPAKTIGGALHGCVVTQTGEVVPESKFNEAYTGYYDHETPKVSDAKVILCVFTYSVWGHILTDAVKRLWFMYTEQFAQMVEQGYKPIALFDHDFRSNPNLRRVFELLDIDVSIFETVSEPTTFSEIIVPDLSISFRDNMYYYTDEYIEAIARIKANIKPKKINVNFPDKIYLSRCNLASAVNVRDYGEKRIERVFRDAGYSVVAPETLDIDDQIVLIMHAGTVAATEGSISHSILFARPHTQLVLLRKANYVNDFQIMANDVAQADVTFIDVSHSLLTPAQTPWCGPFYMYPSRHLFRFLGIKRIVLPRQLDPVYIRYNIDNRQSLARIKGLMAIINMPLAQKKAYVLNKLRVHPTKNVKREVADF